MSNCSLCVQYYLAARVHNMEVEVFLASLFFERFICGSLSRTFAGHSGKILSISLTIPLTTLVSDVSLLNVPIPVSVFSPQLPLVSLYFF